MNIDAKTVAVFVLAGLAYLFGVATIKIQGPVELIMFFGGLTCAFLSLMIAAQPEAKEKKGKKK